MKTSNIASRALALALLVSVLLPSGALAVEGNEAPRSADNVGANFCTNIDAAVTRINGSIANREVKHRERRDAHLERKDGRRDSRDDTLVEHRLKWDESRSNRYSKLDERATTTAQIAAVATFKATIETAVTVRKTAIDAALATFRTGVDAATASRQATIDAALAAFKTSVDAAAAKAKADCASGVDPKTVRDTLKNSLEVARDTLKTALDAVKGTLEPQIQTLKASRDVSIKTAVDAYKASYKAALEVLKAAF